MFAISTDPPGESARFARDYALGFPLLSDQDGAVSRAYVGLNFDDTTIPGTVVIRRDGAIRFRKISESKYDRLTTAQLFAVVDRSLGITGSAARGGYAAFDRVQLRLDAGAGARTTADATRVIGSGSLAALLPLNRHLVVGPWLTTDLTTSLDVDLATIVRIPLLHDIGAIQLSVLVGWSPYGSAAWNASARVGGWHAMTPSWAVQLDLGFGVRGLHEREGIVTFGITRLLRTH